MGTAASRLLLLEPAAALGLCARQWHRKEQAARGALPLKLRGEGLYTMATRGGMGSGEVPRVSGHHLPCSSSRVAEPPTGRSTQGRAQVN